MFPKLSVRALPNRRNYTEVFVTFEALFHEIITQYR
jgi:hypothetical protein